jgi:tyrosyl-tRNA synthetase
MASFFTVQQFLARDRIQKRLEKNDPIWLREFLYPLAQGYDAVELKTDVQIGATEQLFNLMACRRLQEAYGQKPQVCLTFPVLVGTDGVDRMSKSRGNYIGIAEPPETIYGKTMSIPDNIIMQYYELLTDVPTPELEDMKKQLESGVNPMSFKKRLAKEIVAQFYSAKDVRAAEEHFEKTVQNKEIPDDIEEYHLQYDMTISQLLVESSLTNSRSEAVRLIKQGAVTIDGKKIDDFNEIVSRGVIIKVGKRRYLKTV